MTSTDYGQKMDDLRKRVETQANTKCSLDESKNFFSIKMPTNNTIFYILPPVVVLILLVIMRPSFILMDTINKSGEIKKTLVYSKVLICVLIGGFIINIGLFGFLKKKVDG